MVTMYAVYDDVVALVDKELELVNKKFPMFRSDHEGCAFILEKVQGTRKEAKGIKLVYNALWEYIAQPDIADKSFERMLAERLANKAVNLACKAIQVAAMARKFQMSMEHFNE